MRQSRGESCGRVKSVFENVRGRMYTDSHDVIADVDMRQTVSVTADAHQGVLVLGEDPAMSTEGPPFLRPCLDGTVCRCTKAVTS